jgi:hypothetical protein
MSLITRRAVKGSRLTIAEYDANFDSIDQLSPIVVTIVSGIITINGPGMYRVETEGGAGTDDLTGITGGFGREWLVILTLNTSGRVITVKHTLPNFHLMGGQDFLLNSVLDTIPFRDRTSTLWYEVGGRCSVP